MTPIGSSPVRDFMSRGLLVARPDLPLAEVRRLLETRGVSAVPIVDETGTLRGIVSLADLLHGPRGEGPVDAMPVARDVLQPHVVTVDEGARMRDAAGAMLSQQIHRLVVVRDGAPVGILSTRDVARAVLASRDETPLRDRMNPSVLTIDIGLAIDAAIELLTASGVRGLVVLDGQAPVGVFTQLEAVKARGLPAEQRGMPVEEVMSYETICLDVATPLYRVAGYMVQLRARRVLAVEHRRLHGILSSFDLLPTIAAEGR